MAKRTLFAPSFFLAVPSIRAHRQGDRLLAAELQGSRRYWPVPTNRIGALGAPAKVPDLL